MWVARSGIFDSCSTSCHRGSPRISHISANGAHQDGLALWHCARRPSERRKIRSTGTVAFYVEGIRSVSIGSMDLMTRQESIPPIIRLSLQTEFDIHSLTIALYPVHSTRERQRGTRSTGKPGRGYLCVPQRLCVEASSCRALDVRALPLPADPRRRR